MFVSFCNGWLSVRWKTCLSKAVMAQEDMKKAEMSSLRVVK